MIVYDHRRPPFIMDAQGGRPVLPLQPDPDLLEAARWLGTTWSSPRTARTRSSTVSSGRPGARWWAWWRSPCGRSSGGAGGESGVLAIGEHSVYAESLGRLGLSDERIGAHLRAELDAAILAVMEGRA